MASVKEKPPLLGKIVEKSVVLGEQGRFIFHAGRRNPEQGRYFFRSIPIAMRRTGVVRVPCRWRRTTSRLAAITYAHEERKFALLRLALTEA